MQELADAGMRWGVKESFLDYIARTPGSQVSVTEGAGFVAPAREFTFPLSGTAGFDPKNGTGLLEFGGDVRFAGHFGFLYLPLTRPLIEVRSDVALLSFVVPDGRDGDADPVVVAELDWPAPDRSATGLVWRCERVVLAESAVGLFNGSYRGGEALASITVTIPGY
jgi:hypothetical protein